MSEQEVISIEPHEQLIWARIQHAQMDEELTSRMQKQVSEAAEKSRNLPVALDLSKVEFFPSLSLGALVNIMSELKKHQQRFVLIGIQPPIRGALAVTRLDKLFEIYEDADEALAHLGPGKRPG
jgi:anti-sigma B factor antagonist